METVVALRDRSGKMRECKNGALRAQGEYYLLEIKQCTHCERGGTFCEACGFAMEEIDLQELLEQRRAGCANSFYYIR